MPEVPGRPEGTLSLGRGVGGGPSASAIFGLQLGELMMFQLENDELTAPEVSRVTTSRDRESRVL